MTVGRRDGNESPFNAWIRAHPELDSKDNKLCVIDSDLWVHRYSERSDVKRKSTIDIRDVVDNLMLIEIKTFSAEPSFAQRDTLPSSTPCCERPDQSMDGAALLLSTMFDSATGASGSCAASAFTCCNCLGIGRTIRTALCGTASTTCPSAT